MTDKLTPVRCGCGGEAVLCESDKYDSFNFTYMIYCKACGITSDVYDTEAEAVQAWNRAMGGKTVKVENYQDPFGLGGYGDCSECGAEVNEQYVYCPNCGARLEWYE